MCTLGVGPLQQVERGKEREPCASQGSPEGESTGGPRDAGSWGRARHSAGQGGALGQLPPSVVTSKHWVTRDQELPQPDL